MVTFNPYFRSSAKECLDILGGSEINQIKFKKIKLEVDRDEAFDYDTGLSAVYSEKDYIKILQSEITLTRDVRLKQISEYV